MRDVANDVVAWFARNKAALGAILFAAGVVIGVVDKFYNAHVIDFLNELVMTLGGLLLGAGLFRPDRQVRAQQAIERGEQPDRRG